MTLEISEIGVKLAVGDPAEPATDVGTPPATPPLTQSRVRALVAACVRKVLAGLRQIKTR